MKAAQPISWYRKLFANSRFWILATAVTVSANIIGFTQLLTPPGSLQTIRIEQIDGFAALLLMYAAILASPLTAAFPRLPGKDAYLHARRAIGVSACYFALLHSYITLFQQLGGFNGLKYLNSRYSLSLIGGGVALAVLCIMAATSFDWVVDHMGYKHWKLLHRLVYLASAAVLLHVIIIGPHYDDGLTFLGGLTYLAGAALIALELWRIRLNVTKHRASHG